MIGESESYRMSNLENLVTKLLYCDMPIDAFRLSYQAGNLA
jgi:hypothetical protein